MHLMNKKVIFKTYRGQLSKGTQNKNSEETTEGNSNGTNFLSLPYFIKYSAHFYTLKMMLKYSLHTIHGR